jgi:hypothetical protein
VHLVAEMFHLVAHFIDLLTRGVQLHRNNHGLFLSHPFFLPEPFCAQQFPGTFFAKIFQNIPSKKPLHKTILCPKIKKTHSLRVGRNFLPAVSNYRIAPRILDGWVPKSKPVRVGAAIHGHSVFRLSRRNNKYFIRLFARGGLRLMGRRPAIRRAARLLALNFNSAARRCGSG